MDRLIEDYKKALTEEAKAQSRMETFQEILTRIENKAWINVITYDEKLPQWQAKYVVIENMSKMPSYTEGCGKLIGAEFVYREAKIRLLVATEQLKLTKARLYGGYREVLDMQEMAPISDEDLA